MTITLFLNDPSAIKNIVSVCRTLHDLSVKALVVFIGCLLLTLCSLKDYFLCSRVMLPGYAGRKEGLAFLEKKRRV